MEDDAAEAAVRVDAVDLDDGVVGLLGVAVGHIVHVEHHFLHLIDGQPLPLPLILPLRRRRRSGWVEEGRGFESSAGG